METFIRQRSFEISWALFRVAALMRHPRLKAEIENAAIDLLISPNDGLIGKLERLVQLSEAIKEIKAIDAGVLYREFSNLYSAIMRQSQDESSKAEIESIFSKPPMVVKTQEKRKSANGNGNGNGNGNVVNAAMRQVGIIEKIRQLPECQMKDLVAAFPEVSERTLRNDLQRLSEQGLIERVGNGGPASYYKAKNSENLVTPE